MPEGVYGTIVHLLTSALYPWKPKWSVNQQASLNLIRQNNTILESVKEVSLQLVVVITIQVADV